MLHYIYNINWKKPKYMKLVRTEENYSALNEAVTYSRYTTFLVSESWRNTISVPHFTSRVHERIIIAITVSLELHL